MQIDKNVPLPAAGAGRHEKYPMSSMDVGDSFFSTERRGLLNAATQYQRITYGKRFTVRAEGNGFRVWRLK